MNSVPAIRIKKLNKASVNPDADFVLYWMTAHRRPVWNFSLQRAVEWAGELQKPLVILEALRCGYQWASERLHRFILDGMADNARYFEGTSATHYSYVEAKPDEGKGLLAALGAHSCVVVTDDFPAFMLPRMVAAAARQLHIRFEQVDSNGILPLRAADKIYATAYAFRRFLQRELVLHLDKFPVPEPLKGRQLPKLTAIPDGILSRWPLAAPELLEDDPSALALLPIDHEVSAVDLTGGATAARHRMEEFLRHRIGDYHESRNEPEREATSGLSPYLHFGHIASHQVFQRLMEDEDWSLDKLGAKASGSRTGWWGVGEGAEAFLDQLLTWRELGFNMCALRDDYFRYESLPDWAQRTLSEHAGDPRPYLYSQEEFEAARTHDPLWNAAQTQLVREGKIHNYLRMLWGKKVLEWTKSPQEALQIMIELNNKYALDGRDPNSYSGIFWILGRYDRPWGPERRIFGKIRYMSSQNTQRKLEVQNYIKWYSP